MTYTQIVNPNLGMVGNIGWCLSMQENVWGTAHLYANATEAWHNTQFKHTNRSFPDVACLVWFSYFEGGIDEGHVATYVPGRGILSSPYKLNGTQQWFSDVDQCARVLGCTYLGWSEDIANVRVLKGEDMDPLVLKDYQNWKDWGVKAQGALADAGVPPEVINDISQLEPYEKDLINWKAEGLKLQAENADLKAELAKSPIDANTKAEIDQTSQDVGFIKALLNKIFK